MPSRRPIAAIVTGLGVSCGLVLALAGCFRLGAYGLLMVVGAGAFAAAVAAAVRWEDRAAAVRGAEGAAGWTLASLLLLAGVEALAGGTVAAVTGCLAAMGWAGWWLRRAAGRRRGSRNGRFEIAGVRVQESAAQSHLLETLRVIQAPVSLVSTEDLGREWLRTTAELTRRLDPDTHESIVRRRSEALDELERRDPAGFSRWLADGSGPGSDPAEFVRASSPPEG